MITKIGATLSKGIQVYTILSSLSRNRTKVIVMAEDVLNISSGDGKVSGEKMKYLYRSRPGPRKFENHWRHTSRYTDRRLVDVIKIVSCLTTWSQAVFKLLLCAFIDITLLHFTLHYIEVLVRKTEQKKKSSHNWCNGKLKKKKKKTTLKTKKLNVEQLKLWFSHRAHVLKSLEAPALLTTL